ncbi:sulfite exporter TauE/SafE family protein [Pseudonocardia sp. WMMC193]|uniref:sulfite exporter TauE/SafE family protein n=1 Tax=Pseudonocardia sp. WMMC193 TaxID=2911965 RepID=UPI001F2FC76D|nr:sulfite exporter TauE/SafE family protein [Pseudonocardia sp. WMMC193]MCF7552652.1 sulfite exporter TauE/SafE family protein [Pseudonocardia sp. WMMC193]
MLALAAALGLVMGVVVGGLGGGGGVLTVPALVYVLGQSAQDATTSSVIIVGITAAVGAVARIKGGGVDWRNGIALGVVGIPAAYLGTLLNRHVSQPVLLLAFAALTIVAAVAMLLHARRDPEPAPPDDPDTSSPGAGVVAVRTRPARSALLFTAAKVVACGAAVGFLTGFLGVGGGFLVVPALVIVLRMPMSLAVGTSLLVIVLNSMSSVVSRFGGMHLDLHVVAPFTIAAVLGTLIGKRVADRLSGATLTRYFAVMLVAVGLFVGVQSLVAL